MGLPLACGRPCRTCGAGGGLRSGGIAGLVGELMCRREPDGRVVDRNVGPA